MIRLKQRIGEWFEWQYMPLVSIGFISIMGAFLRSYHVGDKSLWFDEAMIYWISQGDLSTVLDQNAAINSAPPLYTLLVALVSKLGNTEAILRSISFLAGAFSVPTFYLLCRRFLSQAGALSAALILAVAPVQIRYSQELREYSLSVLILILMLLAFDSFLEESSWANAGFVGIVIALGLFTHYGLALVILAINLIFLVWCRVTGKCNRAVLTKWGVIQLFAVITVYIVFNLSLRDQWQTGGFAAEGYLSGAYWSGESFQSALSFVVTVTKEIVQFAFPGYMFLVLVYSGVLILLISRDKWISMLYVAVLFSIVAGASLGRFFPYHADRQDLFLTPLVYLTAATGIDYLFQIDPKKVIPSLFILLILRKTSQLLPTYYEAEGGSGVGEIVEELPDIVKPGDPIYVCRDDPVFRYYLMARYRLPENPLFIGIQDSAPGPRDYIEQVDEMLMDNHRAWMLISRWCGDMEPLLVHVSESWNLELIRDVLPDEQLYYVH